MNERNPADLQTAPNVEQPAEQISEPEQKLLPDGSPLRISGSKTPWAYHFWRRFWFGALRFYFRLEVRGLENIPEDGEVLILANHSSYIDPLIVGGPVEREIHSIARENLFPLPLLGRYIRILNAHPIRREGIDRNAIAMCVDLLAAGWPLLIFPEGTRSMDGTVRLLRGGFGMILDRKPDTPCQPVAILGASRAYGRRHILPRPRKITITFGKPFMIPPRAEGESRRHFYQRCTHELIERWEELDVPIEHTE